MVGGCTGFRDSPGCAAAMSGHGVTRKLSSTERKNAFFLYQNKLFLLLIVIVHDCISN